MEFQSNLYHSIALELLYKSFFGSEVIGSSVRPQIPEIRAPEGGAVRYVTLRLFRQFTAQRPIASNRTQKILDRAFQGLSNRLSGHRTRTNGAELWPVEMIDSIKISTHLWTKLCSTCLSRPKNGGKNSRSAPSTWNSWAAD